MKDFLDYVVKALVDYPEDVIIDEMEGSKTTVFELRLNEGDLGKVIGRAGQTARAIRTLLNSVAAREQKRAILEILE